MINYRDNLIYNRSINSTWDYFPIVGSALGLGRICIHSCSAIKNIFKMFFESYASLLQRKTYLIQAGVDLRGVIRGVVEIVPFIGTLGIWFMNSFFLTAAQKLAYRIQNIYNTQLGKNLEVAEDPTLRNLKPGEYEDHVEFKKFISSEWSRVRISTDRVKINQFVTAFNEALVEDPIFNDHLLPFYALAAFAEKQIDANDMATIMDMYMTKKCFPDCRVYRWSNTFDEVARGAAQTVTSRGGIHYNGFHSHEFKLRLETLPLKKRIFWKYKSLISIDTLAKLSLFQQIEILNSPVGGLMASLARINGIVGDGNEEIGLCFDAEEIASRENFHHLQNRLEPRLGLFSPRDIKAAVLTGVSPKRLCATYFPGTREYSTIHGSLELPTVVVRHDKVHAHIMSAYRPDTLFEITQLVRRFETITSMPMSKEIWELVDMLAVSEVLKMQQYSSIEFRAQSSFHDFILDDGITQKDFSIKDLFFKRDKKKTPTVLMWIYALENIENIPQLIVKHFFQRAQERGDWNTLTLKQKIWVLQQSYDQNVSIATSWRQEDCTEPPKLLVPPADEALVFRKVTKGFRKNTVVLMAV